MNKETEEVECQWIKVRAQIEGDFNRRCEPGCQPDGVMSRKKGKKNSQKQQKTKKPLLKNMKHS